MRKAIFSIMAACVFSTVFSIPTSALSEITVAPTTIAEEYGIETAVAATTTSPLLPADGEKVEYFVTTSSILLTADNVKFEYFSELYDYWYKTAEGDVPYPDYVCGVWSTDGGMDKLTVALVTGEKGQKGKEEILSQITNHDSVVFDYKPYTYMELNEVKEKLAAQLVEMTDRGIVSSWGIGVYERENVVHIDIDTTISEVQALIDDCDEKYGNMVVFEHADAIENSIKPAGRVDFVGEENIDIGGSIMPGGGDTGLETMPEMDKPEWYYTTAGAESGEPMSVITTGGQTTDNKNMALLWVTAAAVMIIVLAIIIAQRKRAAQTSAGVMEVAENLNTAQVEEILKATAETPSSDVFEKITKEIE